MKLASKMCQSHKEEEENSQQKEKENQNMIGSVCFVIQLERFYYWYGKKVATYPLAFSLICIIVCTLSGIGLYGYNEEANPYKLWIPQDSDFVRNTEWLWDNFPQDSRFHSVIVTADNVLSPQVMKHILKIHRNLAKARSTDGFGWQDKCYEVPVVDLRGQESAPDPEDMLDFANTDSNTDDYVDYSSNYEDYYYHRQSETRKRRSLQDVLSGDDPSVKLYPEDYCEIVKAVTKPTCYESSLIELWAHDGYLGQRTQSTVNALTVEQILEDINNETFSQIFLNTQNFTAMLGGISYNSNGHIVGAKATLIRFLGKTNTSAISDKDKTAMGVGAPVDQITLDFEADVVRILDKFADEPNVYGIETFVNIARSFTDVSNEAIFTDKDGLIGGIFIVYIYVLFMLGSFGCVEQRPYLAATGLFCIGLSVVSSYGICSALGLLFTPMHTIVPFLLLGIGIDDMFVIVQCLTNLEQSSSTTQMSITEKIGQTMRNAGTAITVTSLTDVVVFAVGSTTVLPGLRSFCIYCAVGIFVVYILQATLFVAVLTYDTRRMEAKRNGFLPCYVHNDWKASAKNWWRTNLCQRLFIKYGRILMHPASKTIVLISTAALCGSSIYGLTQLRQEFNPMWLLPEESSLKQWFNRNQEYFPTDGERVTITIGKIDYTNELWKVADLVEKLSHEEDIVSVVDSWLTGFKDYLEGNKLVQDLFTAFNVSNTEFYERLTQYLFSPKGSKYRKNFMFDSSIQCGIASPPILLSTIEFTHKLFSGPSEHLPAMRKVKELVASLNFSAPAFAVADLYAGWETDEIIASEVYRNIGLSLLCVFVVTAVLLVHWRSCFMVFSCVLLTLVNVGGFMYFWGLTIEIISFCILVVVVGLCIDYAVHIAHSFLVSDKADADERAIDALGSIGPAVLNGGFSTFLAFIMTAGSDTHVFSTFFRMLFLSVVFGLYHGLVYLPVIMSLIGGEARTRSSEPEQIQMDTSNKRTEEQEEPPQEGHSNVAFEEANTYM